jgi:hypothetical protein
MPLRSAAERTTVPLPMRSVYAAQLSFAPGTDADQVLRVVGRWFAQGRAPGEVGESWEPGQRSFPLRQAGHTLDVDVLESEGGRLWQGTWRHPFSEDPAVEIVAEVAVADVAGAVSTALTLRTVRMRDRMADSREALRAPRLVRDLLDRFDVHDAGVTLRARPQILDSPAVDWFVDELLMNPERTRPIVLVSDDSQALRPNVDPDELARELAGLAHVYYTLHGLPAARLGRRLGSLGCPHGALRVWWPGLREGSDPRRHTLLTRDRLRAWRGATSPVDMLFTRLSAAAASLAAPPEHSEIRREARRARMQAAADVSPEWLAEFEQTLDVLDEARIELSATRDERDVAYEARDEAQLRLMELEEELDQVRKSFGQYQVAMDAQSFEESDVADEEPPATVLDAVRRAEPQCPHLAFAPRAFESAENSPFRRPEDILEALIKLERVAALWSRPEGIGTTIAAKADELGLDWKGNVTMSTRPGGSRADQYEVRWKNREWTLGPHVRLGSGSGAGNIARIYLFLYEEPGDFSERRFVIGHVGRKLADSTS